MRLVKARTFASQFQPSWRSYRDFLDVSQEHAKFKLNFQLIQYYSFRSHRPFEHVLIFLVAAKKRSSRLAAFGYTVFFWSHFMYPNVYSKFCCYCVNLMKKDSAFCMSDIRSDSC